MLAKLPDHVQQQARGAYRIFRQNPNHPGLRFKKIWQQPPIYSARVGVAYRAVGTLRNDTVIWYWIGTHAEYDKLIAQL